RGSCTGVVHDLRIAMHRATVARSAASATRDRESGTAAAGATSGATTAAVRLRAAAWHAAITTIAATGSALADAASAACATTRADVDDLDRRHRANDRRVRRIAGERDVAVRVDLRVQGRKGARRYRRARREFG